MKTASLVFLQETADDLRHEIKIQTVYICDPKNVLWLLVLDLACIQPQLLPLTRKRDKTLSCIGKLQCARTFFTDDQFCSQFFFQCRQAMAECRL